MVPVKWFPNLSPSKHGSLIPRSAVDGINLLLTKHCTYCGSNGEYVVPPLFFCACCECNASPLRINPSRSGRQQHWQTTVVPEPQSSGLTVDSQPAILLHSFVGWLVPSPSLIPTASERASSAIQQFLPISLV